MMTELTNEEVDERLKGLAVTGEPRYLRVSELTVDPRYQRPLNQRRVRKIAAEFDPYVIGMLYVSERLDGTKVLLDGQTRKAALVAMGWSDQMIPCYVYANLDVDEEARIFRIMNEDRARPTPIDLFRAKLVEKDTAALDIQRILAAHGYQVGYRSDAGYFRAINAAQRVYRDGGRETLQAVMATISGAWPGTDDGWSMSADMILGLGFLYAEYESEIDRERLVKHLSSELGANVIAKARAVRASLGGSMPTCVVTTLVSIYNKGRRTNRIDDYASRPWRRNALIRRSKDSSSVD